MPVLGIKENHTQSLLLRGAGLIRGVTYICMDMTLGLQSGHKNGVASTCVSDEWCLKRFHEGDWLGWTKKDE
jgi:hypothetical protein